MSKQGLLERLKAGPVIGDGSYVFTLEKRGYVFAGPWTPEAVIEYPDGVRELHREFLRAGSDVLQAFTFYASDGKLKLHDNTTQYTSKAINKAACDIVSEVAQTGDALVCGPLSPSPTYQAGKGDKEQVKAEFRKQCQVFTEYKADFLLGEFFGHVEEAEWAIETMKETGLPVGCTLRAGPTGDNDNVSPGECAVRMAKAGADLVGLNCLYDPFTSLKTIKLMKEALDREGLSPYLMLQPVGFHCPEVEDVKDGYQELPEFPFAMEPRVLTRWDVRRYTREAYNLGVRYFGGCCGFEPHHIREIAEELSEERGCRPPGKDKYLPYGEALRQSIFNNMRVRAGKDYWMNIKPASGRPGHSATSVPISKSKTK